VRQRIVEAALIVIGVAAAARAAWWLLEPLLAPLALLAIVGGLLLWLVRPR
jgi:hypothetical protein